MSGLFSPVDGPKADALGFAVNDGLREAYAGFTVLVSDGEREVDDVGLYFSNSHVEALSFLRYVRGLCGEGGGIAPLTFFIYYTDFFSKNKSFLFSQ